MKIMLCSLLKHTLVSRSLGSHKKWHKIFYQFSKCAKDAACHERGAVLTSRTTLGVPLHRENAPPLSSSFPTAIIAGCGSLAYRAIFRDREKALRGGGGVGVPLLRWPVTSMVRIWTEAWQPDRTVQVERNLFCDLCLCTDDSGTGVGCIYRLLQRSCQMNRAMTL